MMGSQVANIKFDPSKQKLVLCAGCKKEMVVGKFSKNGQRCETCVNPVSKSKQVRRIEQPKQPATAGESFAAKLTKLANDLGFSITDKRLWRKKYAIDDGGVATIHIMVEPGVAGGRHRVDYFSLNIQRAVGVNEEFRRFMPPDAATDCETIAAELGEVTEMKPQIGYTKCDNCGVMTDEFAVDPNNRKVLCITPNKCFRRVVGGSSAEGEV